MPIFGIFFVLLGITLIIVPEIIAYFIGGLLIFIGVNTIIFSLRNSSKGAASSKTWNVGGYEISRRK